MQISVLKWCLFFLWMARVEGSKNIWKRDESAINHRIMKIILKSCYANESLFNPIVIIGNFTESLDASPVIELNEFYNLGEEIKYVRSFGSVKYSASKIILIEDSPTKLASDLTLLRSTRWWDHMALFFIIEKNPKTCENFMDMLRITWRMDILNSIYICTESNNTTVLYTFNPIANYAPSPWKRREEVEHFHMFYQIFYSNIACETLHYDKTKILHGYEVTTIFSDLYVTMPRMMYLHEFNKDLRFSLSYVLLHRLFTLWNVTAHLEKVDYPHDVINRLEEGTADISFDFYPVAPPIETHIPAHLWSEIIAKGKLRQEVSILTAIHQLWGFSLLIVGATALSILLIMLTMQNHNFFTAVLDLIRLLTYTSISISNWSYKFKIYFTTMLIFIVIIKGVLQGFIVTFFIKPEMVSPPQTLNELAELGYQMHASSVHISQVRELCSECNVGISDLFTCMKDASYKLDHVCLTTKIQYKSESNTLNLSSFKRPAFSYQEFFLNRRNWPLRSHVIKCLSWITEFGLLNFWMRAETEKTGFENQAQEAESFLSQYESLNLNDLNFAFQILGLGLLISIIVFLMELIVAKYGKFSRIKLEIRRFMGQGNEMG